MIKLHEKYTGIQNLAPHEKNHNKTPENPYRNSGFHTIHDLEKREVEFHTFPGIPYRVKTLTYYIYILIYKILC